MKTEAFWQQWNHRKWEHKNFYKYYIAGRKENPWPWYSESLDPDLALVLREYGIQRGKLLDLGTCSGSQAIGLAKLGFDVTGTDVSRTAIKKAKASLELARKATDGGRIGNLEFLVDDILDTRLAADQFDVVLDRGCLHSLYHFGKDRYLSNLLRILRPQGMVLLKTMSPKEERFRGWHTFGDDRFPMPHRFEREQLRDCFRAFFTVHEVRDSFFYSANLDTPPLADLTILSKRPGADGPRQAAVGGAEA